MSTSPSRKCEFCGKPLNRRQQRFCSRQCAGKYRHQEATTVVTCAFCGKEFTRLESETQKFCSLQCWGKYRTKVGKVTKECEYCGTEFTSSKSENQRFCSFDCYNAWIVEDRSRHPSWKGGPVEATCSFCGCSFEIIRGRYNWRKKQGQKSFYCSPECHNNGKSRNRTAEKHWNFIGTTELTCDYCGETFQRYLSRHKVMKARNPNGKSYCSEECRYSAHSETMRRENNPAWKGGASLEPYGEGFTEQLKESIRERDGFKCQLCGMTQEQCIREFDCVLDVHHIDYCKANHSPSNLISLCHSCHPITNGNRDHYESLFEEVLCTDP